MLKHSASYQLKKSIRDPRSGNHSYGVSTFDGKRQSLKHIKRNFLHCERERESANVPGESTV